MTVLLDTHALLWWLLDDRRLSESAEGTIETAETVYVSAASAWEIAAKHRSGKLSLPPALTRNLAEIVAREGFSLLPITFRHAEEAGDLPGLHRDPFDRMLIAQAMTEDLTLVSIETLFDGYGVRRLW
jgi:PIN domain nuclease of toxin-antitoxin system